MQMAGLFTLFEFIQYFKFDKPESHRNYISNLNQSYTEKVLAINLFLQWHKKIIL